MIEQPPVPQNSLAGLVFKNATFVTIGMLLLKLANFLFTIYVVRRLGDDRMGQYNTAIAFVSLFQIFAEMGITQYVMREIARDRTKIKTYFWNLVILRALLALMSIAYIPFLGYMFGYSGDILLGIGIYTTSFLLAALSFPLTMVLTAYEELGRVTIVGVFSQLVFIGLGAGLLMSGYGFIWLIAANLASLLVQAVLSIFYIRRLGISGFRFRIQPSQWLPMIRAGLPFGITSLMLSIAFSVDTVVLSQFVPNSEVGWYGVAYHLVFAILAFTGGFKDALVPSLSRVYVKDVEEVKRWFTYTIKMSFLLSMPIAVGGFLLAYPIIHLLYTAEFLPSALALQILVWDVPLLMFASFCGDMTIIANEERAAARINTFNTVSNVVLNLLLIPRFGLVGAALVTVLTDFISAMQFYFLFKRKFSLTSIPWLVARTAAAAVLMGGVIWWLRHLNLFVLTGIGAVVYFVFAVAFRLVGWKEYEMILRFIKKVLRPAAVVTPE